MLAETAGAVAGRNDAAVDSPSLREAARLVLLAVQLAAIGGFAWVFHIEHAAFYRQVLPLALGGAVVNHLLPLRLRPAFFSLLGLGAIVWVFGPRDGAWLIGLGLALIGLCHLPVPLRVRVAVLVAVGALLIALRARWLPAPIPPAIWPILGSMFMFRLAIYLYDLAYQGPAAPGLVLSYFFLLPNVVFPFFPVVDFHTYRRTYYDRPAFAIYEEGVTWIFRGLTQLVLYRLVYQYGTLAPADVTSTATLVRYLVANYALYLRVSGQFHVIVGLLHLFGFRLPETHRFFFLASSVTDLWRRINIYWKDFMQKMVYLPVIFRLKRAGETPRIVVATTAVIGATWLLHSYQWFWLLGTWLFSVTDALFWGLLGLLLIATALYEQRRGRQRQVGPAGSPRAQAARAALQTTAMFALMTLLWAFWSSPTLGDFAALLRAATFRPTDLLVLVLALTTVTAVAFLVRRAGLDAPAPLRGRWPRRLGVVVAPLVLVVTAAMLPVADRLPQAVQAGLHEAYTPSLNRADTEQLRRGYYEQLTSMNRFNRQLWELYAHDEGLADLGAWISRGDALETELRPLSSVVFKGGVFRTNRWGMRDRDYDLAPAPGTQRIAVLGQSYVMGAGVNDGEPFESLIEAALNREWSPKTGRHYELLNFAVSNYSLAQQAIIMENGRVASFHPNVILLIGYPADLQLLSTYVWKEVRAGRTLPPPVAGWLAEAQVGPSTSQADARRKLRGREADLGRWALARVASAARAMGAVPVFALVPMPTDFVVPSDRAALFAAAAAAGFAVIDLSRVYDGYDQDTLYLNPADRHPNAEGHRVIAARLSAELTKLPAVVLRPDAAADLR